MNKKGLQFKHISILIILVITTFTLSIVIPNLLNKKSIENEQSIIIESINESQREALNSIENNALNSQVTEKSKDDLLNLGYTFLTIYYNWEEHKPVDQSAFEAFIDTEQAKHIVEIRDSKPKNTKQEVRDIKANVLTDDPFVVKYELKGLRDGKEESMDYIIGFDRQSGMITQFEESDKE